MNTNSQPPLIKVHPGGQSRMVRFATSDINQTSTARKVASQITQLIEDNYGAPDSNAVGANEEQTLSIDMSDIDFLGSVGLNELINLNRQARVLGVGLILSNVQDSVRDIFALTRLERIFRFGIHDSSSTDHATVGL